MPRELALLFREHIEHVLGPTVVAVLHGFAESRGLRPAEWITQPDLAQVGTSQAALALFVEARAAGVSVEQAINEAADSVGLDGNALLKRRAAWLRHARKKGKKVP